MSYDKSSHTVFRHPYHIVWIAKYRFKVLRGRLRERVREIIRQVCREIGATIISGVLSVDHVHMFGSIPPNVSVSYFMQRVKGRSSHRVCSRNFPNFAKDTGAVGSGAGAISAPPAARSRTTSYFSILRSTPTNLPAPAGSGLVKAVLARVRGFALIPVSG